ncbi:MAG TPA: S8 family peptidase [Candidatus Acidoferrales bacterium]|nr:S8 family peptidase [Candidatus Acidoferrales bacterium]
MPELPRDHPHIHLQDVGRSEPYTSRQRPQTPPPPARNREAHAQTLLMALNQALVGARAQAHARADAAAGGFYLQFELSPGNEEFVQNLEDRRRGIELVSVKRGPEENAAIIATVFVPDRAANYFLRKLKAYQNEDTRKTGRPRYENLVNRIETIALAVIRPFFTDDEDRLPPENQQIWWEIWLRVGLRQQFQAAVATLEIHLTLEDVIEFPEREVILAFSDLATLGTLLTRTDAIAEIRLSKDTPAMFLQMRNIEQRDWIADLLTRLDPPGADAVSVCVLDSGITDVHPLLAVGIQASDLHTYDAAWGTGDSANWQGHGTAMGGVALYGDLRNALSNNSRIRLDHRLESVKMLHPGGIQHDPKLYGAVTAECVARAEISAPQRSRAICMAVTSDFDVRRGRPSSWSATVDRLCFGDETARRLFLISAGNIERAKIPTTGYLSRTDVEPIFNPAQAWNALTIGAFTEKTNITDPTFHGWTALAPNGELAPTSRTSLTWDKQWPIKPELVCEGGNWATDGATVDSPDDLGILTTHHQPLLQQFDIIRDTSAATGVAANLAGRVLAGRPQFWSETVRGLLVHSAEWTPAMLAHLNGNATRQEKLAFLRRYGYGVPNYGRALFSALNDATLIVEDDLQPFWRDAKGDVKTRDMHLHSLPWPRAELETLGDTEVEFRITLSYFVEPNPGDRGWSRRHRYASHGLRFAVKRSLETLQAFQARINGAIEMEEQDLPADTGGDDWLLGSIRNLGSIHSDHWRGTAAELARRDAIAIYPVGGWWKEKPSLARYDKSVRYALIVSIRATAGTIDIYTPIQAAVPIVIRIER